MAEAYLLTDADLAARDARVRADALMEAHGDLVKVAERLEAKGGVHLGTAGGVHLACFRLIELADAAARPADTDQKTP